MHFLGYFRFVDNVLKPSKCKTKHLVGLALRHPLHWLLIWYLVSEKELSLTVMPWSNACIMLNSLPSPYPEEQRIGAGAQEMADLTGLSSDMKYNHIGLSLLILLCRQIFYF